jgi:Immunoglobulin-like domain of bacterial spore germination/Sporulation and spore germination
MDPMTARTRAAALLATSVVLLAGCGNDDEPSAQDPNDPPTTSSPASDEPSQSSATPSASDSDSPETVAAPVYFVGDTPQGPRLFREFRNVEADNPVDEALALLAAGDALDPDYSTLLPGGTVSLESYDENILVSLPADYADRPDGMTAKEANLAVQQIVYTVQGALQRRSPVVFTSDGSPTTVLGIDQESFKAAPQNNVLAFVNVTAPGEGTSVTGTFTASGVANSFEATVPWEVRDQDGTKVLQGFATAEGWGDHLYPWESQVDVSGLPAGTYSFVAMTDDPSDGEGGGPTEDSKTITVG